MWRWRSISTREASKRRLEHRRTRRQLPGALQKCLAYFPASTAPCRLRGTHRRAGVPANQRHARRLRGRLQLPCSRALGGRLARSRPDPVREGLPLARAGVRVAEALDWHWAPALAPARREDDRTDPRNVHVEAVRDDLDTLVLDADVIASVLPTDDSGQTKELVIKIATRLRKHAGSPEFIALGERLERLREQHELGLLTSVSFLKQLPRIGPRSPRCRDTGRSRRRAEDRGKAALTELFQEVRTDQTPIIVERVVSDIDEIVRSVRFPGLAANRRR